MSRRIVIVDGYNLILRTPRLRPGDGRSLADSRNKLVNLLSWAMGADQAKFVVVFDGARESGRAENGARVDVLFSKPPHSADDVIRDLVEKHMNDDVPVTVVTADLEVARHARAMGADIALSDLFLASTIGPGVSEEGGSADVPEKPVSLSKKELEGWAELFKARQGAGRADDDEDDDDTGPPPTVH
jgi:predicted RNA-binding protein with PIN domain